MRNKDESQEHYVERLRQYYGLSEAAIGRLGVAFVGLLDGELTPDNYDATIGDGNFYEVLRSIGFDVDNDARVTDLGGGNIFAEYGAGHAAAFINNLIKKQSNYP